MHMKTILSIIIVIILCYGCKSKNDASTKVTAAPATVPSADIQIKSAVLAAPEGKRDSCTVYGYSPDKKFIILRKGTNEFICLADDPNEADFSVACYYKELEPFMQLGRDLRMKGMKDEQISDEREKEIKEGKLQMPKQPAALDVYSANDSNYNHTTGEVKNGYMRSVIYIPYATTASTGIPEKPTGPGMPWLMYPGTFKAHIMIDP